MISAKCLKSTLSGVIVALSLVLLVQCTGDMRGTGGGDLAIFPKPGDFDGPVSVRLTSDLRDVTIRYTTDGSAPTIDSPEYTDAITIVESTVVQAAAFSAAKEQLAGVGAVYLITPGNGTPAVALVSMLLDDGRSRFEANAIDPDGDTLHYRWYVDGRLQLGAEGSLFITDLRADFERIATVTVKVSDGENAAESTLETRIAAIPVEVDLEQLGLDIQPAASTAAYQNRAPSVSMRAPYGVLEFAEEMRIQARATDPESDPLEYVWLLDGEVVKRGPEPWLDFIQEPVSSRDYSVQVAVSDGTHVRTTMLPIHVNEAQPAARVESVRGDVQVQHFDGEWSTLRRGMALELSDTIATGFGSAATVELGDSVVQVNAMSRLSLDALASDAGTQTTSLFLRVGSVQAEVDASEGKHDFQVMGPHATASVRGTQFSFDGLNLRVYEGAVALKVGPPQRNIQRAQQQSRGPVEAEAEEEETNENNEGAEETAAEESDTEEETAEEETETDDPAAVAEEAAATDGGDEILVGAGESAELSIDASGATAVEVNNTDDENIVFDLDTGIQENTIPDRARLQVFLDFQSVDTSSTVEDGGTVITPSR